MMGDWQSVLLTFGGTVLIAVVGHALHLANKFAVMESKVDDLKDRESDTEAHGNRLTALEGAITDIRNLTSALQTMPVLLSRIETMLQSDGLRISTIEAHLFNIPRFHTNDDREPRSGEK